MVASPRKGAAQAKRQAAAAASASSLIETVDEPHVVGFDNLGNSCFFNSVLQARHCAALNRALRVCWSSLSDYTSALQNLVTLEPFTSHYAAVDVTSQIPLTAALKSFLKTLASSHAGVVKPSGLHSAICKRAPRFKGFQQHDAQELFLVLLDLLDQEEKATLGPGNTSGVETADSDDEAGDEDEESATCATDANTDAADGEHSGGAAAQTNGGSSTTFVERLFGGRTISRVTCDTCGTVTSCVEPFQDVSLPLPSHLSTVATTTVGRKLSSSTATGATAPSSKAGAHSKKAADADDANGADDAAGANNDASASHRLSGKERKKMEKEARRNAKRQRQGARATKYKSAAAKAAGEAALARAAARGDSQNAGGDHPSAQAASDGSSSESDGHEDAPSGDAGAELEMHTVGSQGDSTSLEPERDVAELAAAADNAPDVIVLGPPPAMEQATGVDAPAEQEHDWLSFVDQEASGALGRSIEITDSDDDDDVDELVPTGKAVAELAVPRESSEKTHDGGVVACLRAFCADEQLTGDTRYACEACGKAAAAAREADGGMIRVRRRRKKIGAGSCTKSVRWAPDDQLEAVLIIPSVGKGLPLNDGVRFDHDLHNSEDKEQSETSAASDDAVVCDLADRFGAVSMAAEEDVAKEAVAEEQLESVPVSLPAVDKPAEPPAEVASPHADAVTCDDDDRYEWVELPAPPAPKHVLRDAVKRVRFKSLPPVLVLTLKRFKQDVRGRTRKHSGHVEFEETLDMSPLCDDPQQPGFVTLYRLQGVVEHSGGLNGGHYVAYTRRGQQWFYISDRNVRPTTPSAVFEAEAYLLFYERVE